MRRGQAALEYLVTYGWAILGILIVIGALSYFGLFSPSRYVPARCDFGQQLECIDFGVMEGPDWTNDGNPDYNGGVFIQFRNNFGDHVNVTHVWLGAEEHAASTHFWDPDSSTWTWYEPAYGKVIRQGNVSSLFVYLFELDSDHIILEGERETIPIKVTVRRTSPAGPPHNITGVISTIAASDEDSPAQGIA